MGMTIGPIGLHHRQDRTLDARPHGGTLVQELARFQGLEPGGPADAASTTGAAHGQSDSSARQRQSPLGSRRERGSMPWPLQDDFRCATGPGQSPVLENGEGAFVPGRPLKPGAEAQNRPDPRARASATRPGETERKHISTRANPRVKRQSKYYFQFHYKRVD